jgi:hypothetical protein
MFCVERTLLSAAVDIDVARDFGLAIQFPGKSADKSLRSTLGRAPKDIDGKNGGAGENRTHV